MKMWNKIKDFIVDWIWQLPQNLLGILYKLFIKKSISEEIFYDKGHYYVMLKESKGGVTLGMYIFVWRKYSNLVNVVKHESGHVKQSKILGPLYLIVIGLPSLIWAGIHKYILPNTDYYSFYTEKWANKLAGI